MSDMEEQYIHYSILKEKNKTTSYNLKCKQM